MCLPQDRSERIASLRRFITGFPMAVLIAAAFWVMAVTGELDKSSTFDEIAHLTGGYSYWLTGDYRLHPENGVLPQRFVALPLLLGDYQFPALDQPAWRGSDVWSLGDQFFHQLNNPLEAMLLRGRALVAFAGAALGLLVYAWSRSLFGPAGGMISLLLYAFCPNMLAHGSLMTSDLLLALTLTASVWCFWSMLRKMTVLTVLSSSVAMGLLFVSKMSAGLAIPMVLVLAGGYVVTGRLRDESVGGTADGAWPRVFRLGRVTVALAVHSVIVLVVIWSFYGFRYSAFGSFKQDGDHLYAPWEVVLNESGQAGAAITFAREYRLLPEAYLYGFAYVLHYAKERRAFLNGEYSMTGWRYFFPYAVLVKTPLPLFFILALAALGAVLRVQEESAQTGPAWRTIQEGLGRTAPLWVLLLVYWAAALQSTINIGHRHILPTYPAMFILGGAVVRWFGTRYRVVCGIVVACMLWFAVESLGIRPHYLAYFNQVAGGPAHAYRHLVDSSLDWGQDLPGLKHWLDRHGLGGDTPMPLYLSYFGTSSPEYYRIQAGRLPVFHSPGKKIFFPLTGGVYCVSATMLQALYLEPGGYWRPLYEQVYRDVLAEMERYYQTAGNAAARARLVEEKGQKFWTQQVKRLDQLRLGRLMAYLRQREPDDQVGYSILIYRLSDQDVRNALYGPLAELSLHTLR